MTSFEYVTIPISIVLALGIGKVLSGLMSELESANRDWLHVMWCSVFLLLTLTEWVAMWHLSANAVWTGAEFYAAMANPIVFYTIAHLLVSGQPETVESWTLRMSHISRPLLILFGLTSVIFYSRNYVIFDNPNPMGMLWFLPLLFWVIILFSITFPSRRNLAITATAMLLPVFAALVNAVLIEP